MSYWCSPRLQLGSALVLLTLPMSSSAAEPAEEKPGHSSHGEAFSEGPRQAARLIPDCGEVHFPVTTSSPEAQQFFDQGVGQLHGFWFYEAERSFRQALKLDPECMMAYWGIAMANVENIGRGHRIFEALDREELKPAWDRLPEREQRLIDSLRRTYAQLEEQKSHRKPEPWRELVREWERWLADYPDELEMKAFLVGLIWRNAYRHNVPISSHLSVAALANEVLAVNPQHPTHHYLIHLWDNEAPARALESATRCGPAAPGIAHMWHMPGHTYAKLHRHADAAWHQEASSRVDHAHMISESLMPEEIFNYVHNQGWLVDSLSHVGRVEEAMALARNLIELPRIPQSSAIDEESEQKWAEGRSGYRAGRTRLIQLLWTWEAWPEVLQWKETPWLDAAGDDGWQDQRHWLVATAALRTGDKELAASEFAVVRDRQKKLLISADEAADKARADNPEANEKDLAKAIEDARKPFSRRLEDLERLVGELEALQLWLAGDQEAALARFDELKNVNELRRVRWFNETGQPDQALPLAKELVKKSEGQVPPLVELIRAAHATGSLEERDTAFTKLRELAARADLQAPPLARLQPIADELDWGSDWRLADPETVAVSGERPDLETLGPLCWYPPLAQGWRLGDADGRVHSDKDFVGKPYLLIFFLGRECVHCMEQLNAFAPKVEQFTRAGLPIVAVSTDSVEGLRQTLQTVDGSEHAFPFPLVSDQSGEVFRRFQAWDDFEETALHGTFLIDGDGRVRWQHISFEPFMEVDFLLQEATRLLQIPAAALPTEETFTDVGKDLDAGEG